MNKFKLSALIILLALIAQIPSIKLLLNPPSGHIALGGSPLLSPADINVYLSAIKQGRLGEWLYTNSFTTVDNAKAAIHTLYIFLGHITRLANIPASIIFIVAQFLASITLLISIWALGSSFFRKTKHKILYFLIALFVTGYGWFILLLIKSVPFLHFAKNICTGRCFSIDLWTNQATGFPLLATVPHVTLSASLIIIIVLTTYRYLKRPNQKTAVVLILSSILLSFLSNYHLILLILFNLVIIFLKYKEAKKYQALLLSTFLMTIRVIYLMVVLGSNPSFSNWLRNSIILSPPLPSFIIGWAGLLLPAYFGLKKLPQRSHLFKLIMGVTTLALLLTLIPSPIARNFVLTIPIFLAVFTTYGIIALSSKKWLSKIITILMVFATIDTFVIFVSALNTPLQISNDPSLQFFYLSQHEKEALDWLSENSQGKSAVLTTYRLGNIIPGETGNKVFWGHWSQSGDPINQYKYKWVMEGNNEKEIKEFLRKNNIKWIVQPSDNLYAQEEVVKSHPYLKKVFSNETVIIYKTD